MVSQPDGLITTRYIYWLIDCAERPDLRLASLSLNELGARAYRRLRARAAIGEPTALCDQSQRQTGTRENMLGAHEAVPGRRAEAPRTLAANLVGGHLLVPMYRLTITSISAMRVRGQRASHAGARVRRKLLPPVRPARQAMPACWKLEAARM
jgi:hypothetical protein